MILISCEPADKYASQWVHAVKDRRQKSYISICYVLDKLTRNVFYLEYAATYPISINSD